MRRRAGFSLIELVVVICIVGVLFGVALDRLMRYQELGERAALQQNLAAINVALTLKFASLVAAGRAAEIKAEVGTNPVNLLARPPQNYLGELYAPEPGSVQAGNWYYDRRAGEFVYVPIRNRYLSSPSGTPTALRFRVMVTEPSVAPGASRELAQPYIGPAAPFAWNID